MFIRASDVYAVGDQVRLRVDVSSMRGTFLKDSIVTLISCDERGWTFRDNDSGEMATEVSGMFLGEKTGEIPLRER